MNKQTVLSGNGFRAHYTVDGITTLCGKPVGRKIEVSRSDCHSCEIRTGQRRKGSAK